MKAIEVEDTHKGYFSIDKKGHAVNSAIKRGSDFSDDISAYDLILKNKERLLSFSEPTRFIFSHSALREGWDNPNVFQICTLKHSDSTTMKRQEVGRGLRLCVNQDGFRMDEQSLGKELVHKVNKLTVVASESYKDFVTDLQRQIKDPWDRMDEDEFVQCIKGIVPNPAVQIEIETDKRSESYSSDYFDDLDLSPLLDYSWNNTKNIRKIDIDLTCEEYGFKGRGCIGILIKNDMPVEEIEILSKDVEIDGEIYTLSSSVKYKNNCITETSTSISVDEDGEIDTNTSWSERFKSKSSLSIHGIEVPYNLFPNYSNKMSKAVLNILFPFSFRLDIGVNSDLNLNSARDQIIYDEKWLTFEENLYQVICKRLKEQLSLSDWERLNEIIQKNGKNIFSRVANNIE